MNTSCPRLRLPLALGLWLLAALGLVCPPAAAAEVPAEDALLRVLQTSNSPAEKAMACRQLARRGTARAVPVLAPLLADVELASWARIALEAIPDPAADAALREAAGRLQGRLLVGVLNSLGVRRDAQAVALLTGRLQDADPEVADAAAVALGRIGTPAAAAALKARLLEAVPPLRAALGEGCVRAADHLRVAGQTGAARDLCDAARAAALPPPQRLQALRGALLVRGAEGLPLLRETLRAEDRRSFQLGLRVLRELPGNRVTQVLSSELPSLPPERQPLVLAALADRDDAELRPLLVRVVQATNTPALRLAAVQALERHGTADALPLLLEAALAPQPELARAARQTLSRLRAPGVEAALVARLTTAPDAQRPVLIEVCAARRLTGALPALIPALDAPQPALRRAAVRAVGALGTVSELPALLRALDTAPDEASRADVESALLDVAGRAGAAALEALLPLMKNADPARRQVGLHALASVGGPRALEAVVAATQDADPEVQDEAVRTLSTWPNNWPEDTAVEQPLLALVRSGTKRAHQVLGWRGYLQHLQVDPRLDDAARVERVRALWASLPGTEEKQAALGALGNWRTPAALDFLQARLAEADLVEAACSALVSLASRNIPGVSAETRRAVLQTVVEKSPTEATRQRARGALERMR